MNIHSTDNHDQPQHQKYPNNPAPQQSRPNFLNKIRERFKEKPATREEVNQLRLDTIREELKTRKQAAKSRRPSKLASIIGGGSSGGRRSSTRIRASGPDPLFGGSGGMKGSGMTGEGFNDLFGLNQGKKTRKQNDSGFGQGLSDLF